MTRFHSRAMGDDSPIHRQNTQKRPTASITTQVSSNQILEWFFLTTQIGRTWYFRVERTFLFNILAFYHYCCIITCMGTTIRDIADKLSLSPSTVSRSLQQDDRIHPQTRARVAELAARMGYQGRARRSGGPGKTDTQADVLRLAILLRSQDSHGGPNAMRFLHGMTAEADRLGATISLHALRSRDVDDDPAPHDLPPVVQSGECDAAMLEGQHDPRAVNVIAQHVPVISCEWQYADIAHDVVQADDVAGVAMLVDHLHEAGHRQVAWLGERMRCGYSDQRQAGYIEGCLRHDISIDPRLFIGPEGYDDNRRPTTDALMAAVRLGATAFVCVNDYRAQMVIDTLTEAGLSVPNDISVTGFDGVEPTNPAQRRITSIDPNFVEMGRLAVNLAHRRKSQPAAGHIRVSTQPRVVDGQTISKVKHHS